MNQRKENKTLSQESQQAFSSTIVELNEMSLATVVGGGGYEGGSWGNGGGSWGGGSGGGDHDGWGDHDGGDWGNGGCQCGCPGNTGQGNMSPVGGILGLVPILIPIGIPLGGL